MYLSIYLSIFLYIYLSIYLSIFVLVAQACDKSAYRDSVKMMNDASEVKIRQQKIIKNISIKTLREKFKKIKFYPFTYHLYHTIKKVLCRFTFEYICF